MSRKLTLTEFKKKKINHLTGGKLETYKLPDYPATKGDDGTLANSFVAPDGTYLGNYEQGWWYVKNNMVVCFEYPHGVAIISKHPVKDYEHLDAYKTDGRIGGDDIEGYYGYSHRGGQTFRIGDRLFSEGYNPTEEDYSKEEWAKFVTDRAAAIKKSIKNGWVNNEEEGLMETSISDVIPFKMRGTRLIKTWDEARQAAISMSKYLS